MSENEMNIQVRNGKKVIVTEKVTEYIDDVIWEMKISSKSPVGPYVIFFDIYRRKSIVSGGTEITLIENAELGYVSPENLIKFADLCNELIRIHNATPRNK
jgi:hypothetical protein